MSTETKIPYIIPVILKSVTVNSPAKCYINPTCGRKAAIIAKFGKEMTNTNDNAK